jgi:hypothetical protein
MELVIFCSYYRKNVSRPFTEIGLRDLDKGIDDTHDGTNLPLKLLSPSQSKLIKSQLHQKFEL